jgi:hypothetical protein
MLFSFGPTFGGIVPGGLLPGVKSCAEQTVQFLGRNFMVHFFLFGLLLLFLNLQ